MSGLENLITVQTPLINGCLAVEATASISAEGQTNEWDNVACLPIIDISHQNYKDHLSNEELRFVTCKQLTDHINSIDVKQQLPNIIAENRSSTLLRIMQFLFCTATRLTENRTEQRNRIFAIAIQSFDHRNKFHCQCLYTIYSKLTGNVVNGFRRFGHHWEEIGFQGTDPTTDFRGVGLLGLFQLTFFAVSPETWRLCKEMYDLSLDSVQHFPFAIMSMNITQISLQVLREGRLNRMINQNESVLQVLNRFYYATFHAFFKVWTGERKTIVDTGYVLKDLRTFVRKNMKTMMEECVTVKAKHEPNKYEEDFTNIGNL